MSRTSDQFSLPATPSLTGACGRADLLFALASVQKNVAHEITSREIALAEIFGFFPEAEKQPPDEITGQTSPVKETSSTETAAWPDVFNPYRLVAVETVEVPEAGQAQRQDAKESGKLTPADMAPWDALQPLPHSLPLVPWTRLWPKLRQAVAARHLGGIDYPRLTDGLARGLSLRQLPRLTRLAWPDPLTVILDFSDRLTPYWDDWHWLRLQVQTRLHKQARFFRLHGVPNQPLQALINGKPSGRFEDWPRLNACSTLMLVSDLGMVDPAHSWPVNCWQNRLNAYRRQGVRVVVLAPVSARHLQPALVNAAETVRLSPDSPLRPLSRMRAGKDGAFRSEGQDYAAGNTLLAMVSVATRAEPALLRALRRCLPDAGGDAGLEGEVWCHPHLDTSALACAVSPFAVKAWRAEFRKLDETLQQRTLDCLREWHASLPQAIHHEETLLWFYLTDCQAEAKEAANIRKARAFFERVMHSLQDKDSLSRNPAAYALQLQLADRHVHWAAPVLATHEPYMTPLSVAVTLADTERSTSLPDGLNPIAWLLALLVQTPQTLNLIQQADLSLSLSPDFTPETAAPGASPLAGLSLDRPLVLWAWDKDGHAFTYWLWHWQTIPQDNAPVLPDLLDLPDESLTPAATLCIFTGRQQLRFERLVRPSWAAGMGQDRYGLHADLQFNGIIQRFRWINPGTFMMGSPNDEPERLNNELQHRVTLSQGYWLADSACTQAFWQAVMGGNPSRFQDNNNNPVENVSWDDVQAFIQRLNRSLPGLTARLPSEAEWEYACRAGTTTAFVFGDNITTEQVNYDGGYPYASAVKAEFRGKTLPVKSLPSNPWGLYEMHGNVWEWCVDWYGDYESEPVIDPAGPSDGSYRVLRGGSWYYNARYTRSADRYRNAPVGRHVYYGFRLALGRAGVSSAG